jgi:predicted phage terminase large subunit-like protein
LQDKRRLLEKLQELKHLQQLVAEQARRNFLRDNPTPGVFARRFQRNVRQTPALDAIDRELVLLSRAPLDRGRLMVFVPPQEGKSSRVSCWYPLWRLAQDPTLRIAIVSYNQDKARRWGRWLRAAIVAYPELGITLKTDSRAADHFETTKGGSVLCVGVGGGITGEPVDEMVIDDPVRGRAEAESPRYREAAWEWWESNGATRLSSRGRVVLMLTRWHADDLAGRLIKNEPLEWTVLRIPALRHPDLPVIRGHDGASVYNPDGELISVQNRRPGYYKELKNKRSGYVWRSVYDQDPVAAEGNLFIRNDFRFWQPLPPDRNRVDATGGQRLYLPDTGVTVYLDDCWRFMTVDLAASKSTAADFTVVAVWALTGDGVLILLDRARGRIEEKAHWEMVRPLTSKWACPDVFVERGFIGTTLVIDATKAGIRIQPVDPDTDKITRALPATYRVKSHMVWFPSDVVADWLDEWLDELAEFPSGAHDDQVDVFSYAARITSANWTPPEAPKRETAPAGTVADQAFMAATGSSGPVNFDYQ